MGWKNVKQHYRISHIVRVANDQLCIGSGYIPEIIVVSLAGEIIKRYDRRDGDLARYQEEIEADPVLFAQLMREPDKFDHSIPVFSFLGCEIIEKQCEELGWPNVTHDGDVMYENTWFPTREQAIRAAKQDARSAISGWGGALERVQDELERVKRQLDGAKADLAALEAAYPDAVAAAK